VTDAPTATPRIVRAATETCPGPLRGAPSNAATRHASNGPNKNGNGTFSTHKTAAPTQANTSVQRRRTNKLWGVFTLGGGDDFISSTIR
jgi:hypothetical protein